MTVRRPNRVNAAWANVGSKIAIAAANAVGARPDRPKGDARSRADVAQIVGK
jgi:hypothetical protein